MGGGEDGEEGGNVPRRHSRQRRGGIGGRGMRRRREWRVAQRMGCVDTNGGKGVGHGGGGGAAWGAKSQGDTTQMGKQAGIWDEMYFRDYSREVGPDFWGVEVGEGDFIFTNTRKILTNLAFL